MPLELQRAWSTLEIKSVDPEQRILEGVASTPEPDRQGDSMDSAGAKFALPIPLLWQHQKDKPIGHVLSATVTTSGIQIKARIEKGILPFIDEAWALIKSGLVRGLSIGWLPLAPPLATKGALRYASWEWLELSAVTIPANQFATIQLVKSLDAASLAVSGPSGARVPSISGVPDRTGRTAMNVSEQLTARKAELTTKNARLETLDTKDDLTAEELTERDDLTTDVKGLADAVQRLQVREAASAALAKGIIASTPHDASQSRNIRTAPQVPHHVEVKSNLEPGIEFTRLVLCKTASFIGMMRGEMRSALDIARERYPDNPRIHTHLKAAVAPGMTGEGWAGALVYADTLQSEFIEYLRPETIVGKFGMGNIPSLRRVPFNVRIVGQTAGGTGYWVGQAKPKPLTALAFTPTTLAWAKLAAISVISEEAARFSSPSGEMATRDGLREAIVATMDTDFIDPGKAADAGVSPASITNGVTPIASSGTSADAIRADIKALVAPFLTGLQSPTGIVLIMSHTMALNASQLVNALGQPEFPGLTMNGGMLGGLPVITSQHAAVASSPDAELVIAVNAREIFFSDDGQVTVDVSREASLEMSDAPTQDGSAGTGASLVSLWQNNLLGLRAERYVNWAKRRATAVQYMTGVAWGTGSPA